MGEQLCFSYMHLIINTMMPPTPQYPGKMMLRKRLRLLCYHLPDQVCITAIVWSGDVMDYHTLIMNSLPAQYHDTPLVTGLGKMITHPDHDIKMYHHRIENYHHVYTKIRMYQPYTSMIKPKSISTRLLIFITWWSSYIAPRIACRSMHENTQHLGIRQQYTWSDTTILTDHTSHPGNMIVERLLYHGIMANTWWWAISVC